MSHLAPPALAVSEQMRNHRRTATAALLALVMSSVVVSALMVVVVTGGDDRTANVSVHQKGNDSRSPTPEPRVVAPVADVYRLLLERARPGRP